jgi:hypothetical protein
MGKLGVAVFTFIFAIFAGQTVFAGPQSLPPQDDGSTAAAPRSDSAGLLRQNYITSTGATVPRPGVSQAAGPTALDRGIERLNDKIDNSICKGC